MEEIIENGVRAYKMDTSTPLDMKSCLRTFQTKEMYFRLLPNFEDSGFLENLYKLAYCVQVGNFVEMKERAHSIKGSAAYAGASRISNEWFWIQVYFEQGKYTKMMEHYVALLPYWAEFRIHWRRVYYKYMKKPYRPKPEHSDIPLPYGYKLIKLPRDKFKVTYPDDYMDLAIDAEKWGKQYIPLGEDKYDIVYENDNEEVRYNM